MGKHMVSHKNKFLCENTCLSTNLGIPWEAPPPQNPREKAPPGKKNDRALFSSSAGDDGRMAKMTEIKNIQNV